MAEKEENVYLESIRELVKTVAENQETLDSDKKLKLRDIRKYIADLNFSFLEILKKLKKTLEEPKRAEKTGLK